MAQSMMRAVNAAALVGWGAVLAWTTATWSGEPPPDALLLLTLACELICASEVPRIALGFLRGDLALAVTVHYTRMLMLVVVFPAVSPRTVEVILVAWSLTEAARYLMVLAPSSAFLRTLRYAVPLVTFPLGAGTEAWAAFATLRATPPYALKAVLGLVVVINVGGGAAWYPSMIRKVRRSLNEGKKGKTARAPKAE